MYRGYRHAIVFFVIFGLMLLGSGVWLFFIKIGFSADAVSLYYSGSEISAGKTVSGLLETAVPHLGAMALFIMVTAHFMLFATKDAKLRTAKIALVLFAASALDILSGFFITEPFSVWIWIKLISFAVLAVVGLYLLLSVLFYALWYKPPQ